MLEQQSRGRGDDTPPMYMPYGASGGGGADGQYVFTNLDEIDSIVTDLEAIKNEIRDEDRDFDQAIVLATPPAEDIMSVGQVDAYVAALQEGREHNKAVAAYAENQLIKLRAARQAYIESDFSAAERLQNVAGAGE
jgi:hypothetical protein